MESVGQARLPQACNLLGVPGPGPLDLDADSDDGEVIIGIRPKSSPLPRRRSSLSDEDSGPEPPSLSSCGSRRVSFADSKGLSLVQVKEFDARDVPKPPESSEGEEAEEFFLSPLTFSRPLSTERLFGRVRDQKVELESVQLLPRTTTLKGVIRVLNLAFDKAVYVRTSLDAWSTHFDLLAEYVPGSGDGVVDSFSFKLTLVPPFGEQGARVEFCLRYETPVGTFWANNHNRNYVLSCHQRVKERTHRDNGGKKSCLKTNSLSISPVETPEDVATVVESVNGEEMKSSDGQSETNRQKIKTENRRLSGRRSSRKAARTARVRDHFVQREKERRDSAEAQQKGQIRTEQLSDEPSLSEQRSGHRHLVSESPLTPSKSPSHVQHRASPATDAASDGEPEKPESKDLAVTLTGGEDATDAAGDPLPWYDKAPSECHSINKRVRTAEGKSDKSSRNAAAEQSDGREGGGETFGPVVAPLYQQMFGQRNPKIHGKSASCFKCPTDVTNPADSAQRNGIHPQESNLEDLDYTSNNPPTEEEQADGIQGQGGSLQDAGEVTPEVPNSEVKATQMSQKKRSRKGSQIKAEDLSQTPEPSCDFTPNRIQPSATEETQNICRDSFKGDFSTPRTSLETRAESANYNHTSGDKFVPFKDEDACLEDTTEERTWEMMVEEEEQIILTDPEENTDDTGSDTELENGETTERGRAEEESSSGENRTEDEVVEWMENMERDGGEGTWDLEEAERTNVQKEEDEQEMYINTTEGDVKPEKEGAGEENPKNKEDLQDLEVADADLYVANSEIEEADLQAADTDPEVADADLEVALSQVADFGVADSKVAEADLQVADTDSEVAVEYSEVADAEVALSQVADLGVADSKVGNVDSDIANADSHVSDSEVEEADSEVADTDLQVADSEVADADLHDAAVYSDNADSHVAESKVEEADSEVADRDLVQVADSEVADADLHDAATDSNIANANLQVADSEVGEADSEVADADLHDAATDSDIADADSDVANADSPVADSEVEEADSEVADADSDIGDSDSETRDPATDSKGLRAEEENDDALGFGERLAVTQNEVEDVLLGLMKHIPAEEDLYEEDGLVTKQREEDELECDRTSDHDSASAESDSDDEVELYMHCLRAVHTGSQAQDRGFSAGKRASISRGKPLSTPMPSISESLDEEPHLTCPQDDWEDMDVTDFQPSPGAPPLQSQNTNVHWWKATFSCRNITKTLLFSTLMVLFLVIAYHYDFVACFGLYLISVVWLYFQRERQPAKSDGRTG